MKARLQYFFLIVRKCCFQEKKKVHLIKFFLVLHSSNIVTLFSCYYSYNIMTLFFIKIRKILVQFVFCHRLDLISKSK